MGRSTENNYMLHQLECRGLSEALLLEEAVFRISVLLTNSKTKILTATSLASAT